MITVTTIKSVASLPKEAGQVKFSQGIRDEAAARRYAEKHGVTAVYWLKKQERAYVFVVPNE